MAQVSVAWVLSKEGDYRVYINWVRLNHGMYFLGVSAPIVGTTSLKNLEEIIGQQIHRLQVTDLPIN